MPPIIVGKLFAPFYDNEDAIVDWSDINPTGVTEKLTYPIGNKLNIAANFGQYIFYDNPESGYAVTPYTVSATSVVDGKSVTSNVVENVYSTNPASTIPQDRKEDAILSYNDVVAHLQADRAGDPDRCRPGSSTYLLHGSVGLSGNAVGTVRPLQPQLAQHP